MKEMLSNKLGEIQSCFVINTCNLSTGLLLQYVAVINSDHILVKLKFNKRKANIKMTKKHLICFFMLLITSMKM